SSCITSNGTPVAASVGHREAGHAVRSGLHDPGSDAEADLRDPAVAVPAGDVRRDRQPDGGTGCGRQDLAQSAAVDARLLLYPADSRHPAADPDLPDLLRAGPVFADMTLFGKPLMRALPFLRDGIYYAIFALSLNTAGYTGEILRGAILAVPHGEIEAGRAFGMSKWMIFRRITLPRAIRICLPTMSTETILLLKATALASTVTVYEVLGMAQYIRAQTFRVYETFIGAGIIYIVLVFILTRILNWLERRLNKDRERPVSIPLAQTVKP